MVRPDVKMKFQYSDKVLKGLKNTLNQDIMKATEGSAAMRKEIARVFQMANRRIQNIEKAGVVSPAVEALGKGEVKRYSKFAVGKLGNTGSDWRELRREYAKAIAFLNQPTSTAAGAREFEKQVQKQLGMDKETWERVKVDYVKGYTKFRAEMFSAMPYQDMVQEIYQNAVQTSSKQIESETKTIERRIKDNITGQSDSASKKATDKIKEKFDDIIKRFGL